MKPTIEQIREAFEVVIDRCCKHAAQYGPTHDIVADAITELEAARKEVGRLERRRTELLCAIDRLDCTVREGDSGLYHCSQDRLCLACRYRHLGEEVKRKDAALQRIEAGLKDDSIEAEDFPAEIPAIITAALSKGGPYGTAADHFKKCGPFCEHVEHCRYCMDIYGGCTEHVWDWDASITWKGLP